MADLRSNLKGLADHLLVPELPSHEELAKRARRRRQRRTTSLVTAFGVVALVVGLLVSLLPGPAPHRSVVSSPRDIALTAGRKAFATYGGPPVGAIGIIGSDGLWLLDGDGLFVSNNNGATWTRTTPPSAGDPLADYLGIDFLNLQQGWVVASAEQNVQVDRTVDGGSTWQATSLPTSLFPEGWNGADVNFISSLDGWVTVQPYVAQGKPATSVLLSSTDGGATWNVTNPDTPVSRISFVTAQVGWGISAEGTTLYRTTDGGRSWQQVSLPSPMASAGSASAWKTLTMPVFLGDHGVLLAVPTSGNAVVEVTSDGGQTWSPEESPFQAEAVYPPVTTPGLQPSCAQCVEPTEEPFSVFSPSDWVYWGGGRLYVTTDGGRTWSSMQPNLSFLGLGTSVTTVGGQRVPASAVPLQFSSSTNGWAVMTVNAQSLLVTTRDGGHDFAGVSPPSGPLP